MASVGGGREAPLLIRLALAAALALHLAVLVSIARQPLDVNVAAPDQRSLIWPLHNDTVHRIGPGADFFCVYHAGLQLRAGRSPYQPAAGREAVPYYYPFRYLPIVAETLGRAVVAVGPRAAYLAWLSVLEATLLLLCLGLLRYAPSESLRWVGPCLLLLSSPYFLELHMGQFSFLTAALYVTALILCTTESLYRRLAWLAAATYAGAVLLKIFPLVAFPALMRNRTGRRCAAIAVGSLLVSAVPLFLLHGDWWRDFAAANLSAGQMSGLDAGNHGLLFVVFQAARDLGLNWTPQRWKITCWTAQILFLGAASLAALMSRPPSPIVSGAALYLGHTLSYFQIWEHHLSGAVVVGVALLWGLEGSDARRWERLTATAAVVCLALPTPFRLFDHALDVHLWDPSGTWPHYAHYLLPLCKAGPALALYGVSLSTLFRRSAGGIRDLSHEQHAAGGNVA
jgi:hypothetical protein